MPPSQSNDQRICEAYVCGTNCGEPATHTIDTQGRAPWLDGEGRCELHAEMMGAWTSATLVPLEVEA